jgi:hypothetical protein
MLAFSLDNLLFLLLIAGAALFQLLSKAISKAGKSDSNETSSSPSPQTPRPVQRSPRESDADRIRKFLEALGQPPSSTPPSPVLPRTDIPPRRLAPVQPPPVIHGAWRLPRERAKKPDVSQGESTPLGQRGRLQQTVSPPPVPPSATPAFEVHKALPVELEQPPIIETPVESDAAASQVIAKREGSNRNIARLLASKSSLRQAILLREILGQPRGLQAFDLL